MKHINMTGRMLAFFLVGILCIAMSFGMTGCSKKQPEEEPPKEEQEVETIYGDASLGIDAKVDEQLRDYRHILLLGIDNGNRSDVLMVVSVNKKTNKAKVVAVHRDTYMQIAEDGTYNIKGVEREFFKCNRAYKRDGIYGAMTELNRHMDLNIREAIAIDWDGITHLVDSLGGIEVDVTEGMISWMNGQLGDGDKITSSGVQTLNGRQAVQYLRCRKDPGSDATTRDARNQAVFKALFDKAKGMSTSELSEVYDQVADELDTNMSRTTLTETLALVASTDLEETPGWPYEYSVLWQNDNSFYYFVSDTLESNVIELHKVLFGQEDYKPSGTVMTLNEKLETARKEQLN